MAQEQTAYVGDDIKVLVNVIGSTGAHVVAVIDTTTTRLNGLAAAPTITTIATGVYQIVFSGVTPTPAESDRYTCKVNGTIAGVAWTEYGIPIKIVADERGTDSVVVPTSDITAIKSKTDQLAFTVANEVDSNSLTGGTSPAAIYTEFTSGSNADAFKATGFNTVAPDNASITLILADTNELQTNQGNWLTATGFNTVAPDNSGISANGVLIASNGSVIAGLNDFDPASDTVAHVALVDTTTDLTNAGGTGLYQATVRVQDTATDSLQGARVNVDGTTLTLTTGTSGEITFNLDSGVYLLDVSPPAGFETPTSAVLTISGSDPSDTVFTLVSNTTPGSCDPAWL